MSPTIKQECPHGDCSDRAQCTEHCGDLHQEDDEDEICSGCSGSGEGMYDGSTCYKCHGSGVELNEKDEDV